MAVTIVRQRHGPRVWRRQPRQVHRSGGAGADRGIGELRRAEGDAGCADPAFNYFAFWYVLGAAAFWWIGFETGGRSIEEIDAALSAPASSSEGMAAVRTSR